MRWSGGTSWGCGKIRLRRNIGLFGRRRGILGRWVVWCWNGREGCWQSSPESWQRRRKDILSKEDGPRAGHS